MKDKIKLLLSKNSSLFDISFFIIISAFVSILIMDIIVMPITVFAVEKTVLFNTILKNTAIATILIMLIWTIANKSLQMKRAGHSVLKILAALSIKPFKFLGIVFSFITIVGLIIFILYLFFSINNLFLYKIMSN